MTFSALSVFNQMIVPLIVMPTMFTYHVNAVISTKRLRAYFDAPEIEENDHGRPQRSAVTNGDVHQHEMDSDDSVSEIKTWISSCSRSIIILIITHNSKYSTFFHL